LTRTAISGQRHDRRMYCSDEYQFCSGNWWPRALRTSGDSAGAKAQPLFWAFAGRSKNREEEGNMGSCFPRSPKATAGTLILIWNDHRDRGHQPSFLEDQGWGTGLVEVRGIPGAQRRGTWGIQPSLFNSPPAPGPHGWRAAAEVELRAILGPMQTLVAWNTRFRGWNYFQFPD
jgi:hypothetical protein